MLSQTAISWAKVLRRKLVYLFFDQVKNSALIAADESIRKVFPIAFVQEMGELPELLVQRVLIGL